MAQIVQFRAPFGARRQPPRAPKHEVHIRVADGHPFTRWMAQYAVQRAAAFSALRGFTDALVGRGGWHRFLVSHHLIARMVRDLEPLFASGSVRLVIDRKEIRRRRSA